MTHVSASAEGASEKILMNTCKVCEKFAYFHTSSIHERCTKEDRDFKMLQNHILATPCIVLPPAQFGDNASAEGASEEILCIVRGFSIFFESSPLKLARNRARSQYLENWTQGERGNGQSTFWTPPTQISTCFPRGMDHSTALFDHSWQPDQSLPKGRTHGRAFLRAPPIKNMKQETRERRRCERKDFGMLPLPMAKFSDSSPPP